MNILKMKHLLAILLFMTPTLSFASDMSIRLLPGWNTFSTPKTISAISFSNWWSGISFYTLSWSSWQSVQVSTSTIKPLEWFVVYNSNNSSVFVDLTFKTWLTPQEQLLSKNLNVWWNLLWVSSANNPFWIIWQNATYAVDFTKSAALWNGLNSLVSSFATYNWNALLSTMNIDYGEAYPVFMTQTWTYGWSQSENNEWWISYSNLSQSNTTTAIWSNNISLIKVDMWSLVSSGVAIRQFVFWTWSTTTADMDSVFTWITLKVTDSWNNTIYEKNLWSMQWYTLEFNELNKQFDIWSNVIIPEWTSWLKMELIWNINNNWSLAWKKFSIKLNSIRMIWNDSDKSLIVFDNSKNTVTWTEYTIWNAWTVSFTSSSSNPRQSLVTESSSVNVLAFDAQSSWEDETLDSLEVWFSGSVSSIESVYLSNWSGWNSATWAISGTGITFNSIWYSVPDWMRKTLYVKVNLKGKLSWATAWNIFQAKVRWYKFIWASSSVATTGWTLSSWAELATIIWNPQLVTYSKPVLATSSFSATNTLIYKFSVTNSTSETLTLSWIWLKLSWTAFNNFWTWTQISIYQWSTISAWYLAFSWTVTSTDSWNIYVASYSGNPDTLRQVTNSIVEYSVVISAWIANATYWNILVTSVQSIQYSDNASNSHSIPYSDSSYYLQTLPLQDATYNY